jgi:hypothetical protein
MSIEEACVMSQKFALFALAITIGMILCGSLYPFEYRGPATEMGPWIALLQSWKPWPPETDFVVNLFFYAPLGASGVLSIPENIPRPYRVALTVLAGALLSTATELMQFYVGRDTSIFDIVANSVGTFVAAISVMYLALKRQLARLQNLSGQSS